MKKEDSYKEILEKMIELRDRYRSKKRKLNTVRNILILSWLGFCLFFNNFPIHIIVRIILFGLGTFLLIREFKVLLTRLIKSDREKWMELDRLQNEYWKEKKK